MHCGGKVGREWGVWGFRVEMGSSLPYPDSTKSHVVGRWAVQLSGPRAQLGSAARVRQAV